MAQISELLQEEVADKIANLTAYFDDLLRSIRKEALTFVYKVHNQCHSQHLIHNHLQCWVVKQEDSDQDEFGPPVKESQGV